MYFPSSASFSAKSLRKFRKNAEIIDETIMIEQQREDRYRTQNQHLKEDLDNALRDLAELDTHARQVENKLHQQGTLNDDLQRENQILKTKLQDQQSSIKIAKVESDLNLKSLHKELELLQRDNKRFEDENRHLKQQQQQQPMMVTSQQRQALTMSPQQRAQQQRQQFQQHAPQQQYIPDHYEPYDPFKEPPRDYNPIHNSNASGQNQMQYY